VQRLWSYCNILRDDGLSYPDYVEQLTYLLYLKMAYEQRHSRGVPIPRMYEWTTLLGREGVALNEHYSAILRELGTADGMLGVIFKSAENKIKDPAKLRLLIVDLIDKENWSALDTDVKGDAYEGLLEKNAQDTKSGAGQYFTPRPVIRAIMNCVQPKPREVVYDPACGTGGFLVAAYDYVTANFELDIKDRDHLRLQAIRGTELVGAVARLAAMNLSLHGIGPESGSANVPIVTHDSLASPAIDIADVVLTNPPFGKKASFMVTGDDDWTGDGSLVIRRPDFRATTSNKQLNFVQHVMTSLRPGGRAAVVVPDNVLFEGGAGETVRRWLLDEFVLHTILRLPPGIFYAQGVKANVIFFDRPVDRRNQRKLWIYDLRTDFRVTLRNNPLEEAHLSEFVRCYGGRRRNRRREQPDSPRWKEFEYKEIIRREKCSLDIFWLRSTESRFTTNDTPAEIATGIAHDLESALLAIKSIAGEL
jgi:type I restriction enzyme M protein